MGLCNIEDRRTTARCRQVLGLSAAFDAHLAFVFAKGVREFAAHSPDAIHFLTLRIASAISGYCFGGNFGRLL